MTSHRPFAAADDPAFARLFGGAGGVPFDDAVVGGDQVAALWLGAACLVDSLQVAYRNGRRTSRHGGPGGAGAWVALEPGERLLAASGRCDRFVAYLALHTTRRTVFGGDPEAPGAPFHLAAPDGHHVVGFHGRCGWFLDAVGIRLAPLPPPAPAPHDRARTALRGMPPVRFAPLPVREPMP